MARLTYAPRIVLCLFCSLPVVACGGGGADEPSEDEDGRSGDGDGDGDGDGTPQVIACETDNDCNDTNACNGEEECTEGFCSAGEEVDCDDEIDCTRDVCDPVDGTCVHVAPDNDGDGHAALNCLDADENPLGDDCDDLDPDRFPGNIEVCHTDAPGHDEDCDDTTFGTRDLDADGFTSSVCFNETEAGDKNRGEDCNDQQRSVNPIASEVCDGFDNNCDGETDEDLLIYGYRDKDGDYVGVPVTTADLLPGDIVDGEGRLAVCPGDEALALEDIDCDDENRLVHKYMSELCDGVDNNCDGETDNEIVEATWYPDFDGDGYGVSGGVIRLSCEVQVGWSLYPGDCNDTNPLVNPGMREFCDGLDNDCDPTTTFAVAPGDFEDDDKDGSADPACGLLVSDCDDTDPNTRPGAPELCDGKDNDCNGAVDTQTQKVLWYIDADGDGWGSAEAQPIDSCDAIAGRVAKVGDCEDNNPARNPGQADDCTGIPGFDDDCDGVQDEDEVAIAYFRDFDGDGYGQTNSAPLFACQAPAGWSSVAGDCDDVSSTTSPETAEICTPGQNIDDNCDGFTDCADAACATDEDCLGLYVIALEAPAKPVTALIATDFTATVSVKNSVGTPQVAYALNATCKDGAITTTPDLITDGDGEAEITIYPGIATGLYECTVSDAGGFAIPLKLSIQGIAPQRDTIQTVFNLDGGTGNAVNGEAALLANINDPIAIEVNDEGYVYVLNNSPVEVWEISPRGVIRPVLASAGINGGAVLATAYHIAMDPVANHLYLGGSASGGAVFRFDLNTNSMQRVLGGGSTAYFDGMNGTDVDISLPYGIHFRAGVGLAVSDSDERIWLLRPNGTITRWTGDVDCYSGRPSIRTCTTNTGSACGIAVSETGDLLSFASWCDGVGNERYRLARFTQDDTQRLLLTTADSGGGNGLPLPSLSLGTSRHIDFDRNGNLLLVDQFRVRFIDRREQVAWDLAGGGVQGFSGDGGPSTSALLNDPYDASAGPDGSIWIVTRDDRRVRRIWRPTLASSVESINMSLVSAPPTATVAYPATSIEVLVEDQDGTPVPGVSTLYYGTANALDVEGPAITAANGVASMALRGSMLADSYDYLAVAQDLHGAVMASINFPLVVTEPAPGIISVLANRTRKNSSTANSSWAPNSDLQQPQDVAVRSDGVIYVVSQNVIWALSPDGSLTRVAGGGSDTPNNVAALSANLGAVEGLFLDETTDRLYISTYNDILTYDINGGVVWIAVPTGNSSYPGAIATSPDGTELYYRLAGGLYVADMTVYPSVSSLVLDAAAVSGECAFVGSASLPYTGNVGSYRHGMAYGPDGLLYYMGRRCLENAASHTEALLTIDPDTGTPTWIADLNHEVGQAMVFGPDGKLYFANQGLENVMRWSQASGFQLVAGTGTTGFLGDLGLATAADLNYPRGVAFTPAGDLIFVESNNDWLRKIWGVAPPL